MVAHGYRRSVCGRVIIVLPSVHLQSMLPCVGVSVIFVALSSVPANVAVCPSPQLTPLHGLKSVIIGAGLRSMSM